ncbi:MAG TPA: hypothetical protein VIE86_02555 [Nitrososphaera sp.]|jgi:hypothetical protein
MPFSDYDSIMAALPPMPIEGESAMEPDKEIAAMLKALHVSYLKENENDEGDPIFCRINYKIADTFGITAEKANRLHLDYHKEHPRRISEGFCDICGKVVPIVPVIYGVKPSDLPRMKAAEAQGRLIIGEIGKLTPGSGASLFGCRICKSHLPKYGGL